MVMPWLRPIGHGIGVGRAERGLSCGEQEEYEAECADDEEDEAPLHEGFGRCGAWRKDAVGWKSVSA